MRTLDNPAPCFIASVPLDFLCLFSTRTKMHRIAKLLCDICNLISDISCIQAEMLFVVLGGLRKFNHDAFNCLSCQFDIVPVCSSNCNADRYSIGFSQKTSFSPFFALSVGLAPVASPPRGDFVIAPSRDCHFRFKPFISSYTSNPLAQKVSNTPASIHS